MNPQTTTLLGFLVMLSVGACSTQTPVSPDEQTPVSPDDPSLVTASAGSVLWNGDVESGTWPSLTQMVRCSSGRISIYSATSKPAGAPNPRRGTRASKFSVLATDVYPCTPTANPRASVASPQSTFYEGDERWVAFSLFIPTNFPTVQRDFFMFSQVYGYPYSSEPPIGFYLVSNYSRISFNGNYNAATKQAQSLVSLPVTKGRWLDFLLHLRISKTKSVGFVELWYNGHSVTFNDGRTKHYEQTMLSGATRHDFSILSYRGRLSGFPEATIYFDQARVGTARSVVEIL